MKATMTYRCYTVIRVANKQMKLTVPSVGPERRATELSRRWRKPKQRHLGKVWCRAVSRPYVTT